MVRRRNRGGNGRVSAMSNECRIVNGDGGSGFVNKNKKVMAASKNAVVITKSYIETPSYRVEKYSATRSAKYTEDMSDDVFQKRYHKLEQDERIRKKKRRDLQQMKESIRVEYLKQDRNKHHSQKSNDNNKEELKTLLPSPWNIKAIEITNELPVSAFSVN